MGRTKIFVSYSHEDNVWLAKVTQHLAVLKRQGVVDLWADTEIGVGADWQKEIENALTAAKVAVMLVSPAFLASEFIWSDEMPRIIAHSEQGMDALPLIVRPCAWRLEESLARLQARPVDGRPLSLGSDSQIDSDLMKFTYELAARIGRSPASDAAPVGPGSSTSGRQTRPKLVGSWEGRYNRTRRIRLVMRETTGETFSGEMEYPSEKTVTFVEGTLHDSWSRDDPVWAQLDSGSDAKNRIGARFRETDYKERGSSTISFDGEYRGFIQGNKMTGAWFSGSRLVGTFALDRK